MINYIFAENLKHKHSFLKKLLVIMPISLILLSLLLMPSYFTTNSYNWWYVIIMPATFALIPAMMHRKESRKLNYRAVFPLNINLKKLWVSKIITAFIYMSITAIIHMLGVYIFQFFVGEQLTPSYTFLTLLCSSALLIITNIWQIPFCFFLAKKFGFIVSIAINAVLGLTLGILLSDSAFWIYCPYSWGIRLMIPVMHILPSGVLMEESNPIISNTSLYIPCILSICLFTLLAMISAKWFSKQEVK
ncbi:lantibiotic immunity ABC transporter MutE/EpiE family permease subunit [Atopobacter sp. AH10]|uniref:lantibiotic immunity ABC transporter MutE/EpiE family permease subunit n=1 Tax=Atopobacter sp. AH10 TaxID=2315861 RepID=UPI000EF1DBBC|nr:lantibiotic immunity ABC transporter MutE/EpiE family permease subunit [Atopobacter sp. AH10]RLK63040.1 lantibiotic immunity ABC transporter MutE/EpiE family permease subunit [Atopobacter sp. AH10]